MGLWVRKSKSASVSNIKLKYIYRFDKYKLVDCFIFKHLHNVNLPLQLFNVKRKYPGDLPWYDKLHDKANVKCIFSTFWHFTDGIGSKPLIGKLRFFARNLPPCVGGSGLLAVGCSMAVAAAVPTAKKLTSQQG